MKVDDNADCDVFVIATFTNATGGFDWFYKEADAAAHHAKQLAEPYKQHVRNVGRVRVPAGLDRDGITAWLDSDGFELWNVEPDARTEGTPA